MDLQPATTSLLTVNRHDLYVETYGPQGAPVVVLLHHGLGSVRSWKAQVPALVESGFRVIAYDRWGYGGSGPRPNLSIPFFTDDLQDLHALLERLEVAELNLVGHSDGGNIALRFAAEQPSRVIRLAAIAAHVYVEPKMKTGIEIVRNSFESTSGFRQGMRRMHGEKFEAVFDHWFHGWVRRENLDWDMRAELSRITCPALFVQGMEDEYATPQHARDAAAAIPNAELWLLPGAGHMLPQEQPEAFNPRLVEFLERSD